MNEWKKWPVKILEQKDFPKNLQLVTPQVKKLFYRGEFNEKIFEKVVAVVGSRKISRYGKDVIEKMMPEIVARNTTVISGFMYGVDSEAHSQCLEIGGKTVAILGSGLNYLYPTENDKLYTKILENGGLVMSEYENDFKPTLWSFPQRNRIVSGLSTVGVLVIEAGIKSGSLITSKLGMNQGKQILAIPGPINSKTSEGTNWLIKTGAARMVTIPNDIFEDKIQMPEQESLFKDYSNLSKLERNIVDILESEAVTIDEICQKTKRLTAEISTTISLMMIKDLVTEENGKFYIS
jgi:DNA processing protein